MPLTDIAIRKAKPAEKPVRLADEKGLYLEIAPGGGKWWRLKYRFGGKEKRLSLGVYPEVGLKEARDRRDAARDLLGKGVDPSQSRRAQKVAQATEDTFESLAREWFAKFSPTWGSQKYRDVTLRRLVLNVFPWIGPRPVKEITAPELLTVIRRIEDRGAVDSAHRILGLCGSVFRYAVASGRADQDPSVSLHDALTPRKGTHFAATTDPKRLGEILKAMDGYKGSLIVRCALRLVPLVFVRPGELRRAKWEDIDLEAGEWRYFVTKTKTQHIVPLSRQARAILKELHPLTGALDYVFPGARSWDRPMSDNAVLVAMRLMGIGQEEMSGHGFRAVARTILDEVLGFRPDIIEHQLAHAVKDPNGTAYNRTAHLPERRKMMQKWADHLDTLKG